MKRTRCTMPARSQGKLYAQRQQARLTEKDVETLVRKWLTVRLDNFYCDLRAFRARTAPWWASARLAVLLGRLGWRRGGAV